MIQPRLILAAAFVLAHGASAVATPGAEQGEYQGIPWFSGGVGAGEREEISAQIAPKYNLKLVFADRSGGYMGDVHVRIVQSTRTVMDANSKGPWFFTRLEPGSYEVTASAKGRRFEQEVNVPSKGMRTVTFSGWATAPGPQPTPAELEQAEE
jgi:hypothetical protein